MASGIGGGGFINVRFFGCRGCLIALPSFADSMYVEDQLGASGSHRSNCR